LHGRRQDLAESVQDDQRRRFLVPVDPGRRWCRRPGPARSWSGTGTPGGWGHRPAAAFGGWSERWYATTAALRPTTRHDYRALLDNQVLPAFAAARLVDIDALAVREWLAGLVGGNLSAKRARKAHQVRAQVLDAAVDGGRLARNVAAGVKLPKVQRREMGFLDAVQVEQLADAIDPRYPTLVRVAAYTWPPAVRAGRAPGPAAWHGAGRRGGTRSRRAP
jgi:hypothetical protein